MAEMGFVPIGFTSGVNEVRDTNSFSVGKHLARTGLGDDFKSSIRRHSTTDRDPL